MKKAIGGDGIPVELFQILKDDAVKMLHSIFQEIGKLSSGHRTGKFIIANTLFQPPREDSPHRHQQMSIQISEEGNAKKF